MKKVIHRLLLSIVFPISFCLMLASCTTVKEYQKGKLNDSEMVLANRKIEKTELSFQSYREGAAGASSGKSGGGCGCN
jgi:starvation-inducible outer membrane lipoprotein